MWILHSVIFSSQSGLIQWPYSLATLFFHLQYLTASLFKISKLREIESHCYKKHDGSENFKKVPSSAVTQSIKHDDETASGEEDESPPPRCRLTHINASQSSNSRHILTSSVWRRLWGSGLHSKNCCSTEGDQQEQKKELIGQRNTRNYLWSHQNVSFSFMLSHFKQCLEQVWEAEGKQFLPACVAFDFYIELNK